MGLFCDYYKGMCYKRIFQLHRQLRGGIDRQVIVLHRGKQQLLAARNLFLYLAEVCLRYTKASCHLALRVFAARLYHSFT